MSNVYEDKVLKLANIIDSIVWNDSGDLIPQSSTEFGYRIERHQFMREVYVNCIRLLNNRVEAHQRRKA